MKVLQRFTVNEECQYLFDRPMRLEYAMVAQLSPEEYEEKMNQGYRKFGPFLFHPKCRNCKECRPIRIPTARFQPDRSMRRALKRNADLIVRLDEPTLDDERLELYNKYHNSQADRKGWPSEKKDAEDYTFSFLMNTLPAIEISIWEPTESGEILRAIVLTEITPNVVSGIYHYYDPDLRDRSLGAFAMLHTIDLARRLEKPYSYFGYYVAGSASMVYKARFRPCELMGDDGVWREFEPEKPGQEFE